MELQEVESGLKIRTAAVLGGTDGMLVKPRYLTARKPGAEGEVHSFVPGHGGDVWFVDHGQGSVAAYYCFDEFEAVSP